MPEPRWIIHLPTTLTSQDAAAGLLAQPNPADGSHRLRGAADSDVLIVLEEGARDYAAGDLVEVLPL